MGWIHEQVLANEASVTANGSPTTIGGPWDVRQSTGVDGFVENTDGAQTETVWVESSWDGSTNWVTLPGEPNASQFIDPIAASTRKPFGFDTTQLRYIRIRAQASGAGLTTKVSARSTWELPNK